jgi:hypothetical protein
MYTGNVRHPAAMRCFESVDALDTVAYKCMPLILTCSQRGLLIDAEVEGYAKPAAVAVAQAQ